MFGHAHSIPLLVSIEGVVILGDSSNLKDVSDAVKGIIEAVPIYQDALQPAAKEIGKALQTVTKTIHIALAPVSALVWGYDKIKDYVSDSLTQKLQNVPEDQIISPNLLIAGPTFESLHKRLAAPFFSRQRRKGHPVRIGS